MDYLRLILLVTSVVSLIMFLRLHKEVVVPDSGWRSRVTAELVSGRSAVSAILDEEGDDARRALHRACRGLPFTPPTEGSTESILLGAAYAARGGSLRMTEHAVSSVKAVLETFDEDETKMKESVSAARFRGFILATVLCFLAPFFVEMLPLLGLLQGATLSLAPADPALRYLGPALALVSSYQMSRVGGGERKGNGWGMMAAFTAALFVSTSLATSLPLLGAG